MDNIRSEFQPTINDFKQDKPHSLYLQGIRLIFRRVINVLVTLFVIAYLVSWGLILAERGRQHLPARPLQAAWQALINVGGYLFNHPQTYYLLALNDSFFG